MSVQPINLSQTMITNFKALVSALAVSLTLFGVAQTGFMDGDIIFIKNTEIKGKSLLPNGKSKFNYVGVVFLENAVPYVYHSMEPFSKTLLTDFVKLSEKSEFGIKHLTEEEALTAEVIQTMKNFSAAKVGSVYDNQLSLNNEEFYNAEFVWKLYKAALGLPLCIPREIKEYKMENPSALEFLTDAYGEKILNEKIVTVGDIYQSQFLE